MLCICIRTFTSVFALFCVIDTEPVLLYWLGGTSTGYKPVFWAFVVSFWCDVVRVCFFVGFVLSLGRAIKIIFKTQTKPIKKPTTKAQRSGW